MRYLIMLLALLAVSGCAAITERPATSMLAVSYATMKYIGEDADKAQRVRETAAFLRGSLADAEVTLDALDAALHAAIQWDKIDRADETLLRALLLELRDTLDRRFGAGMLAPDELVALRQVADWIIQAAR